MHGTNHRIIVRAAIVALCLFFPSITHAATSTISYEDVQNIWSAGTFDSWWNLGYNGNNNCSVKGEGSVKIPLTQTGTLTYILAHVARTTPASNNGHYGFRFYATTTAWSASAPTCNTTACPYTDVFNSGDMYSLAFSGDPNSPTNRTETPTGSSLLTLDFASISGGVLVTSGDALWLSVEVCIGPTGTLANERLWIAGEPLTSAVLNAGLDGQINDESIFSSANGTSLTTLVDPGIYNINSTTTASAQFDCDKLGVIGEHICNAMLYLFAPSASNITYFTSKKDALFTKVPFGYFSEVSGDIMDAMSTSTASSTSWDASMKIGDTTSTIHFISSAEINEVLESPDASESMNLIKNGIRAFLAILTLGLIYIEIRGARFFLG